MDGSGDSGDSPLVVAMAKGDEEAFSTLYRRYLPLVTRWCLRETGSRELAADLSAEVFAAAITASRRYQAGEGSVSGWLLGIARNSAFAWLDSFERVVYFATLLLAALAAVCTIGPAAQHRVLFRRDDKGYVVRRAQDLALAGLAFLALAMCGALLLVATCLFGTATGIITATAMACVFGTVWFALPLRREQHGPS